MEKFSAPVKHDEGGSEVGEWFNTTYRDNPLWGGEGTVNVVKTDGKTRHRIPRSDVAILFKELTIRRTGNTDITSYYSNVGSNSVAATPVGLVGGHETYIPAFSHIKADMQTHELTKGRKDWKPWVVQPVPIFKGGDELQMLRTKMVMQQNARIWVSGGANNIDMTDDHVANMLISQQSSLMHHYTKLIIEKCLDHKEGLAYAREMVKQIYLHYESVRSYLNLYPETKRPIEGLCKADFVNDVLQRGISAYILDYSLTKENKLRLLEWSLKRVFKHHGYTGEHEKETLPGVHAVFNFPQLISRSKDHKELTTLWFNQLVNIRSRVKKLKKDPTAEGLYRALVFYEIVRSFFERKVEVDGETVVETDLPFDKFHELFKWCHDADNYRNDADLVEMKLVKPVKVEFEYSIKSLKIKSRALYNSAQVQKKTDAVLSVMGKSPTDWTGINLLTDGIYTVKTEILGDALKRGSMQYGTQYALSFTTGNEVLPVRKELYGDDGISYEKGSRVMIRRNGLDLQQTFYIIIDVGGYWVYQGNEVKFCGVCERKPLLLAFRRLNLTINYQPIPSAVDIPMDDKYNKRLISMSKRKNARKTIRIDSDEYAPITINKLDSL